MNPDHVRPPNHPAFKAPVGASIGANGGGGNGSSGGGGGSMPREPSYPPPGGSSYSASIEARLEEWAAAKRTKDYTTADRVRDELRAKGVDPEKVRPFAQGGYGGGGGHRSAAPAAPPPPAYAPPYGYPPPPHHPHQPPPYHAPPPAGYDSYHDSYHQPPPPHYPHYPPPYHQQPPPYHEPTPPAPSYHASYSGGGGGGGGGGGALLDPYMAARLEEWVAAKRVRDYPTADRLREELRAHGVDAEALRPAVAGSKRPRRDAGY